MGAKIEHLGHASFRISDGARKVYIDPYELAADSPRADAILITHDHFDHCSAADVEALAGPGTVVLAPPRCRASLAGLPGAFVEVVPGATYDAGGVEVRTVPAYNVGKPFHPRGAGGVGYLLRMGGEIVYHAGDTDLIPEMDGLAPDVALLPVGGTYTMTAEEAAEAFRRLGARRTMPMHFGSVVGTKADAERFVRLTGG